MVRLEGALTGHAQVLGLLLSQLGQLHVQLAQVGFSHCLIQLWRNAGKPQVSAMPQNPLPAFSHQFSTFSLIHSSSPCRLVGL